MRLEPINCSKRGGDKPAPRRPARRRCAGFTLAEVLAALLLMAIVIPVAVQGVLVASRASIVGQRKAVAVRIAERVLNELVVIGQGQLGAQNGVIEEGNQQYSWQASLDLWSQSSAGFEPVTMQMLTVQVQFPVQGQEYTVQLSTLVGADSLL